MATDPSGRFWRFTSSTEPDTIVTVHDKASADALIRIFQGKLKGTWTMQAYKAAEPAPDHPSQVAAEAAPATSTPSPAPAPLAAPNSAAAASSDPSHPARKHPRRKVKLWVTLMFGKQQFRSFTHEISLGGLSIDAKVPVPMLGQFCRMYLHGAAEGERIEMRCRVVADPRNPRRIQFLSPEPEALERLSGWLETLREKTKVA